MGYRIAVVGATGVGLVSSGLPSVLLPPCLPGVIMFPLLLSFRFDFPPFRGDFLLSYVVHPLGNAARDGSRAACALEVFLIIS